MTATAPSDSRRRWLILALIGLKMCLVNRVHVPTTLSLAVTLAILVGTSIASLVRDGGLRHSV